MDDYGINAKLNKLILLTKIGGKFEQYKSTLLRMEGSTSVDLDLRQLNHA